MPGRATRTWYIVGIIIILVASITLGLIAMPALPALTHDSVLYINAAQNLVHTGHLTVDIVGDRSPQPDADLMQTYMPGYALTIALLLGLGMDESVALQISTLLLLASLVGLIYALAWRLTKNLVVALSTGILTLTFPPILDGMTYGLSESLYIPLTVAAFLATAGYMQTEEYKAGRLLLLSLLLSLPPLVRPTGLALVPAIGAVIVARSLWNRRWGRAGREAIASGFSFLPAGFIFATSYFSSGRAYNAFFAEVPTVDVTSITITRGWLVHFLLNQLAPQLEIGLGFRRMSIAIANSRVGLVTVLILLFLFGVGMVWRYRHELRAAAAALLLWTHWPIVLYTIIYLAFFIGVFTGAAQFDFSYPRFFIPVYPFLILLVAIIGHVVYHNLPVLTIRGVILLALFVYLAGNFQAVVDFVGVAHQGRGIESPELRNHAAISYVRQELREQDLLFSTKAPILWYYLRHPARRLRGVHSFSCQQLPSPESEGRSVFVLFPAYVYSGDPATPAEVAWFQQWISKCGIVEKAQVLGDTAVYIVVPQHDSSE